MRMRLPRLPWVGAPQHVCTFLSPLQLACAGGSFCLCRLSTRRTAAHGGLGAGSVACTCAPEPACARAYLCDLCCRAMCA